MRKIIKKRVLVVFVLLVVWFVGHYLFRKHTHIQDAATSSRAQTVRFREINSEVIRDVVPVRGYTKAWQIVSVKARTQGEIKKINVTSGQKVKKGELLIEFNLDDRAERLAYAKNERIARELEYNALSKLGEMEYHSKADIANKRASFYKAIADEKQAELNLKYARIRAPFDGVVGALALEKGDLVSSLLPDASKVIEIAKLDPIRVVVFCTGKDIGKVKVGQCSEIIVDNVSGIQKGHVASVNPVADAAIRTYRVDIKIENKDYKIMDGMAVTGKIIVGNVKGFFIPSSALCLSDNGSTGIKVLVDQNKAKFYPIQIVSMSNNGAWVTDLPLQKVKLITVGHEYVVDGEEVIPIRE